jgi:hypothetical protein
MVLIEQFNLIQAILLIANHPLVLARKLQIAIDLTAPKQGPH